MPKPKQRPLATAKPLFSATLTRRFRRHTRNSNLLYFAIFLFFSCSVLLFFPSLFFTAPRPTSHPPQVESVPPPEGPPPAGPPPYDIRLQILNNLIDPAKPLVDDNTVDKLSIVPRNAYTSNISLPPISAVVLFHNEYPTLQHTLQTWLKSDLLSHITEIIFFLNGVTSRADFLNKLTILDSPPWSATTRIHLNPENLKLGLAIRRMVQLASHDYVLLLEKDWALIEPPHTVVHQLHTGIRLLNSSTAHVVRYRHRKFPGAPLHARIMHENREPQMLAQQTNLYCYIHHWIPDPTIRYAKYFSRCNGTRPQDKVWCSNSKYCQWTNNPALFKKQWFLSQLGDKFAADYSNTIRDHPKSNMLDFEFYTNWNSSIWNDRDFVVALPPGLFEHNEVGEQNLMNTVWYAWKRLSTDVEEKRNLLLETEARECKRLNKTLSSGATFKARFPLDFVRHYHYKQAMMKTNKDAIRDLTQEVMKIRKQFDDGHGTWRNGVTDLTNYWYTVVLYEFPVEPQDMKIGFVTSLFRTDENEKEFEKATNSLVENIESMATHITIVYCDEASKSLVKKRLDSQFGNDVEKSGKVVFEISEVDDLVDGFLTSRYVEIAEKLYKKKRWQNVTKLRSQGVLTSLKRLLIDMCKPYILDDAVRLSEESEDGSKLQSLSHLVWFDARSKCMRVGKNRASARREGKWNDDVMRAYMMLHVLVSGVEAQSVDELEGLMYGSGFRAERFLVEMQVSMSDGVRMADMKTMGGAKLGIRLMKGYYDVVLRNMLKIGELGNGREALSIAIHNVRYNFMFLNGVSGCGMEIEKGCGMRVGNKHMLEDSEESCGLMERSSECAFVR